MKVGVVGVGYVGLSTAACLATKFKTVAVDINESRIAELSNGKVPLHERGVEGLVRKGLASRRLTFSSDSYDLGGVEAIFIAVGTPGKEDGSVDLQQVRGACADIGASIRKSQNRPLVLVKSTVVPGTARTVAKPVLEERSGKRCGDGFLLCSNPEFLREGSAIEDTKRPSRIVVGAFDDLALRSARSLYRKFYGRNVPPVVATTPEGAELIKYGSNSFLATKVSFINLLARVCERFPGTDVADVARGMGLDPRIGKLFLQAGPGFGGSCFPKDVRAFSRFLSQAGEDPALLESVLGLNDSQPSHIPALLGNGGSVSGKEIAVLGLAFKADTDDVRESRSIPLVKALLEKGAKVRVYDPAAIPKSRGELGASVTYCASAKECITGADLAITMTAWREFKALKPADYSRLMRSPVLIDARRIYDPKRYSKQVAYHAVGLGEFGA